jgi:hypothetical protein
VNPPHSCQALLGSTRAKVSWEVPQLVGDQGKGAFKVSFDEHLISVEIVQNHFFLL